MPSYPFAMPPPVALAAAVDGFTVPGVSDMVWEAKWDGFRAIVTPERLWSRAGKPLARYFPEIARDAAQRLPPGCVLDTEIISWNAVTQRTDFTALTRRFTAGNRVAGLAERQPAQLVAFDLLAANGADLRLWPLLERRARLAALLAEAGEPRSRSASRPTASTRHRDGSGTTPLPGSRDWWRSGPASPTRPTHAHSEFGELTAPRR